MKILAVEFSTNQRSVAVLEGESLRATAMEVAARETRAFALIEQALTDARLEREQIECLAVGLGPGSYTGIRVAIAVAQGWQLALPVKLLGISSADCLAAEAQAKGWFGRVTIAIDAQRNELYAARYEVGAEFCRVVDPLKLAARDEIHARVSSDDLIVGPEVDRWFTAGKVLFPTAAILGRLVAGRTDFVSGEKLEPIYLRETSYVKAPKSRNVPGG